MQAPEGLGALKHRWMGQWCAALGWERVGRVCAGADVFEDGGGKKLSGMQRVAAAPCV